MDIKITLYRKTDFDLLYLFQAKVIKGVSIKKMLSSYFNGNIEYIKVSDLPHFKDDEIPKRKEIKIKISDEKVETALASARYRQMSHFIKMLIRRYYQCDLNEIYLTGVIPKTEPLIFSTVSKLQEPSISVATIVPAGLNPEIRPRKKEEDDFDMFGALDKMMDLY